MKRVVLLRRMSNDQLKNRLRELTNSLWRLKSFVKRGGLPDNYAVIRSMRKEKARIFTILTERRNKVRGQWLVAKEAQ